MSEALTLKVQVDMDAAARKLGVLAGQALRQALRAGFVEALDYGASAVVQAMKGRLRQPTGNLAGSVIPQPGADPRQLDGYIGVPPDSPAARYAYLLTADSRDIRPTGGRRALTIPIGANLTGAGAPRFASVAELKKQFGERVFFAKRFVGVRSKTSRGSWALYFLLSGGVTVRGRNVLHPTLEAETPAMTRTVQDRVDEVLRG